MSFGFTQGASPELVWLDCPHTLLVCCFGLQPPVLLHLIPRPCVFPVFPICSQFCIPLIFFPLGLSCVTLVFWSFLEL